MVRALGYIFLTSFFIYVSIWTRNTIRIRKTTHLEAHGENIIQERRLLRLCEKLAYSTGAYAAKANGLGGDEKVTLYFPGGTELTIVASAGKDERGVLEVR